MGDPECQTILPKLKTDLLEVIISCCDEKLSDLKIDWDNNKSLCIVVCSKGYPDDYKKNIIINNLNLIKSENYEYCYHAGTKIKNNEIYAIGGRVLNFVCLSDSFKEGRKKIVEKINSLKWDGGFFRKDIAYKVIDE